MSSWSVDVPPSQWWPPGYIYTSGGWPTAGSSVAIVQCHCCVARRQCRARALTPAAISLVVGIDSCLVFSQVFGLALDASFLIAIVEIYALQFFKHCKETLTKHLY